VYRIFGPKGHLIVRSATLARVKQILPSLRRRFGKIRLVNLTPPLSKRKRIVRWARWGVDNTGAIHYTETPERADWLHANPFDRLPLTTDCSGFATLCYRLAGAPDPNGLNYLTLGYTGTMLDHAAQDGTILTDVSKAKPGDLIVYGPGTGTHVAIIVEAGSDPLTVSHGQESEPAYVKVSQDGRQPQRICRYLR
jgi:cell wall-associated NlpC family hydrolase